ncbi:MAG: hypothetical protein QOE51_4925 [Actinoplanes sp.]|jgi:hypothetical protein|nr:hypothetical protein [Actinoplanes sp.]
MAPFAVPVFALTVWLAGYLIGRDPRRAVLWRTALALVTFAAGVAAWTVAPGGGVAGLLFCLPPLAWASALIGLLPAALPERRQIERGWLVLGAVFLVLVVALPSGGKLVALAPLAGGLVLIGRFRELVRPRLLLPAMSAVAVLYAIALAVLLIPVDLGPPALVIAAMGLDLLIFGLLVAVADAVDSGERLRPDLRRSAVAALAAALLVGGTATLTMLAAPDLRAVAVLQFGLVAIVMAAVGLAGSVRRGLDRVAFLHDERLRLDRAALQMLAEALPRRRERHSLIALSPPEFARLTERALTEFGDLGRLLRSPLIDLPTVDRRLTGTTADRPLARAVELQAVLVESVARLKPSGLFGTTEDWRHYNALHYCCVLGLRPYERRPRTEGLDQDGRRALEWFRRYVPKRSLRQWQSEGAEVVAGRLWTDLVSSDPRWLTRTTTANATRGR